MSQDLLDYPAVKWPVLARDPQSVIGADWLRWFQRVHTVISGPVSSTQGITTLPPQSTDITNGTVPTPVIGGACRINWYLEVTGAGAGTSLQVTVGWTRNRQALSRSSAPLAGGTVGANDSQSIPVVVDDNAPITYAVTGTTGVTQFTFSIWVIQP